MRKSSLKFTGQLALVALALALLSCSDSDSDSDPTVTVPVPDTNAKLAVTSTVRSVVIAPETLTLTAIGQEAVLTATTGRMVGRTIDDADFRWTSLDPYIASVDTDGRVFASDVGTARIVVTPECCDYADTAVVTVTQEPAMVILLPDTATLDAGVAVAMAAAVADANGVAIPGVELDWSSSDPEVATVMQGVVRGLTAGTAVIRAASGLLADSAVVTVRSGSVPGSPPGSVPVLTTIVINPRTARLAVGSSVQLTAVARDQNGNVMSAQSFVWTSSNRAVARVSTTGLTTGIAAGKAIITVLAGGESRKVEIVVGAAVDDEAPPPDTVPEDPTDPSETPTPTGPPPPAPTLPPSPGTGANEPTGMYRVHHNDGSSLYMGGKWSYTGKWLDGIHNAVVNDATNPTGSGKAIEKRWFVGEPGDNGQGLASLRHFSDVGGFPARVLYVRLRVKFSPNYDVTPNYGGMKFGYWGMQGGPNATYMTWINTDGMRPFVHLGAQNPHPSYFGPAGFFKVNVWYTLEMVITAQSAKGVADGRYEWWINGTKVVDAQGQLFVDATSTFGPLIDGYQLFFIRGSTSISFQVDDWVRIGELYISEKP